MEATPNRGHGAGQSVDWGSGDTGGRGASSNQQITSNQGASSQQQTPSTSALPSSSSQPTNAPAPPERPPRPMNAWLIFRNHQVKLMQDANPTERRAQGQLSKEIAELWRSAPVETKRAYESLAREKKEQHARLYPDYQYTPGNKGGGKAKRVRRQQSSNPPRSATPQGASDSPSLPNLSLPNPSPSSSTQSGPSPRMRASPQLGYHPYSAGRSNSETTLPPINTSYSSTSWQNTGSLSAVSPYYSQSWQSFESHAGTGDPQQYHQAPSSAPADYAASFSDHRRSLNDMRQSFGSPPYLNPVPQYSPTWPAAASLASPSSSSPNDISSSTTSNSQQRANYGFQPFDYSLYRAPIPNPQPQSQSQSHYSIHSTYPSLSSHSNPTYSSSHETYHEQQPESSESSSIPQRSTPTPISSSSPYPPFESHQQQQQHYTNPQHQINEQRFPVETHFHYEITLPPSSTAPPSENPYPPPDFE